MFVNQTDSHYCPLCAQPYYNSLFKAKIQQLSIPGNYQKQIFEGINNLVD